MLRPWFLHAFLLFISLTPSPSHGLRRPSDRERGQRVKKGNSAPRDELTNTRAARSEYTRDFCALRAG